MGVAEGTHLAFDAGDVLAAEIDEEDVAGEEGCIGLHNSNVRAFAGAGFEVMRYRF